MNHGNSEPESPQEEQRDLVDQGSAYEDETNEENVAHELTLKAKLNTDPAEGQKATR